MKKIALFDFDGTITVNDTFITFAKYALGKKAFYKAFLKSVPWLIAWKIGISNNSAAKQRLFSFLYRGMPMYEFHEKCEGFTSIINQSLKPGTINMLESHQYNGQTVMIVSASIADWIKPWAKQRNITAVIGTQIEVDPSGRLTGKFATPNCHGIEKVNRIRQAIPDISTYEIWAYGDSTGDDAMLYIATHPVRIK